VGGGDGGDGDGKHELGIAVVICTPVISQRFRKVSELGAKHPP